MSYTSYCRCSMQIRTITASELPSKSPKIRDMWEEFDEQEEEDEITDNDWEESQKGNSGNAK